MFIGIKDVSRCIVAMSVHVGTQEVYTADVFLWCLDVKRHLNTSSGVQ